MSSRLRVLARLLAALPPILVLVFGVLIIRREFNRARYDIVRALTAEISSSMGVTVRVDDVQAGAPGKLVLRGLRIGKPGMGDVIRAKEATVTYSLAELARNLSSPASTVSAVRLDEPYLFLERSRDGRLNLLDLFRRQAPSQKPFRGRLEVVNGMVRYVDHGPLSGEALPVVVLAHDVNGSLDLSSPGRPFEAEIARTSASGRAVVRGAFDRQGRLALNAGVRGLSLPFLDRYLIPGDGLGLYGGIADGRVVLTMGPRSRPVLWVNAKASGATLKLPGRMPLITGVDGRIRIAGAGAVVFDGSATAAGGRWRISGSAANMDSPLLQLRASSPAADYARLASLAPPGSLRGMSLSGSGPVRVLVRGPLASLRVSGEANVPRVRYGGYQVSHVRAAFDYDGDRIVLPAISGEAGRGQIAGYGTIMLGARPGLSGQVRLSRVSLSAVNPKLSGTLWGEADLALLGNAQTGRVVFQVRDPAGFGRRASSAVGDLRLSGSRLFVDSLLVATPQGYTTASGSVDLAHGQKGRLDLAVSGAGITMRDILGQSSAVEASGTFDAEGRVTGPAASPAFEGRVQGLKVVWQSENVDVLSGNLYISRSRFSTQGLTVIRGASEATVRGDILQPLSPARRLDLTASVKALPLEDLSSYFPAVASPQGTVSGELTRVSGTAGNLRVDFDLTAENGRYRAYSVPIASVRGTYDRGELLLASLTAKRGAAVLTAAGSLKKQGLLDIEFRLSSLPLEDVLPMIVGQPLALTGTVSLDGHLGGTTPEPVLTAAARVEGLNVGGEEVRATAGQVSWSGDVLSLSDAVLRIAGGSVSIDELKISTAEDAPGLISGVVSAGTFAGVPRSVSIEDAASVDLSRALLLARTLGLMSRIPEERFREVAFTAPEHVKGSLDGVLRLSGSAQGLTSDLQVAVGGLQVWGAPLGTASLEFEKSPAGYAVRKLTLDDGEMRVSASGTLTASNEVSADVEGNNLNLRTIPGIPALRDAAGKLDFSFQASGTLSKPQIEGSVLVADGRIGHVDIERFTTGRITADSDSVEIAETTVATGPHRLRLSGTLPFSIVSMAFVDGGTVDIQARLVDPDLNILTLISSRFDPERTKGAAEAQVAVTGSWPAPQLEGYVRVADGAIALKGAETVFERVKINLALNGPNITIADFQLPSSHGGVLTLSGGASLGSDGWALRVGALATDMGLRFRNLSGMYGESYNGRVDVDLTAAGPLTGMMIAGTVTAHHGAVGLPATTGVAGESVRFPVNPALDVIVAAGTGLKARGPRLNVGVRGKARLAQSLNAPLLNGRLEVTDGFLLFPGSRFRVVPIGSIDFRYAPPEPAMVNVDIRAETNLSAGEGPNRRGVSSYRVEMAVRGPLENPRVSFQSYPPGLEASGILAMLGQQAGVGPSGFGGGGAFEREVAQLFTANIAPGVLQPVELALAEALGLQEVAFGFGGRDSPLNIQLRRHLFGGVNLMYWRTLTAGPEQDEWKLTYDVTDRFRLTYGESRFRARTVGIEGALNF